MRKGILNVGASDEERSGRFRVRCQPVSCWIAVRYAGTRRVAQQVSARDRQMGQHSGDDQPICDTRAALAAHPGVSECVSIHLDRVFGSRANLGARRVELALVLRQVPIGSIATLGLPWLPGECARRGRRTVTTPNLGCSAVQKQADEAAVADIRGADDYRVDAAGGSVHTCVPLHPDVPVGVISRPARFGTWASREVCPRRGLRKDRGVERWGCGANAYLTS